MTAPLLSPLRRAALSIMVLMAVPASGQMADPRSGIRPEEKRSGYSFMSRETQAMQDDDLANPGTLWVLEGAALWRMAAGARGTGQQPI